MSNLQVYLITIGAVVVICFTPVGKILQSDSFLFVSLGIIAVLFVFACIMTLRVKRKKNKKGTINERIEALLSEKKGNKYEQDI